MPAATPDRLLLTGPPGSGKTTALTDRFAGLVEDGVDPSRILLLVATRRSARAVRRRLIGRLGRSLAALPVTTVHGFAYGVLGRRYADMEYTEPPIVLSAPEQVSWIATMLEGEGAERWTAYAHLKDVKGFARDLASLVLRAQERLLDPEALAESAGGTPGGRDVAEFYGRYIDALALANRIDHAGLLAQTAHVLSDGLAEDERFEHVLVDDYQESTIAGEAIVAALGAGARGVWIAGDPAGPVLSSRGATREPFDRAAETFAVTETRALGSSRRAEAAEAREYAHPGEEADAIAVAALDARVNGDVPWQEIAVVVRRMNTFVTTLRHALARAGIPHVVVDEGALVSAEPSVRPILDAIRYALHPAERDALLEPLLLSPIGGLDPYGVRRLRREARLRWLTMAELADAPGELPNDLAGALARIREIVDAVSGLRDRPPDELFFELWRRLEYVAALVERDDAEATRAVDALVGFADRLGRYARTHDGATFEDYLETFASAEFSPDPVVLTEERRPDAVRIMTAHRAHGLEFDTVIVANCIEGEFPSLRLREPIVDLDTSLRPGRTHGDRMREHLEEERRLFALATSRARRATILTASRAASARNPRTPSRYGGAWSPAPRPQSGTGDATGRGAIASALRRTLADPRAPAVQRLAALAALPSAGASPDTWWDAREWSGTGAPLFGDEIKTSYSRLSSMDNCGLQYLYEVEMGLDPEQSYQMWLGAVIHEIIEDASHGRIARDWDALNAALKARWNTSVFPNRAVMHRRYLDARQMLWRWFKEETPDPAFSEVAFEFPIDGAILRGKIDAVFRLDDGTVRLVDYKTGRFPPTQEEADRDLQLAAYFLALRRVPELAELGEPSALELSYLAANEAKGITIRRVSPARRPAYETDAAARIEGLLARVREERFDPSPQANCRWCSFKILCPLWPEGGDVPR